MKTLATLPDVQILFQSSPGPQGVLLRHTVSGLTCSLQLVRLSGGPSGSSGGASCGQPGGLLTTRVCLRDEVQDLVVTYRDGLAPEEARVLQHLVKGRPAWDSGQGWLLLFDGLTQLPQFSSEWLYLRLPLVVCVFVYVGRWVGGASGGAGAQVLGW